MKKPCTVCVADRLAKQQAKSPLDGPTTCIDVHRRQIILNQIYETPCSHKPCIVCATDRLEKLRVEFENDGPTTRHNWIQRHLQFTQIYKTPCSHNL